MEKADVESAQGWRDDTLEWRIQFQGNDVVMRAKHHGFDMFVQARPSFGVVWAVYSGDRLVGHDSVRIQQNAAGIAALAAQAFVERTAVIQSAVESAPAEQRAGRENRAKLLTTKVEAAGFSTRALNGLHGRADTVDELVRLSEADVLKLKNVGRGTLRSMQDELAGMGLRLGMTAADIAAYVVDGPPIEGGVVIEWRTEKQGGNTVHVAEYRGLDLWVMATAFAGVVWRVSQRGREKATGVCRTIAPAMLAAEQAAETFIEAAASSAKGEA